MTIEQFQQELMDQLARIEADEVPILVAAADARAASAIRIFSMSENVDNQPLLSAKSYSTKPTYISKSIAGNTGSFMGKKGKKVSAKNPNRTNVGAREREITSAYFPGGYAEFKQQIGRPPLEVTGALQKDWANGFLFAESALEAVSGFKNPVNNDIALGNEELRGIIFALTEHEAQIFVDSHFNQLIKRDLI